MHRENCLLQPGLAALFLTIILTPVFGIITGSAHDFSASGWNSSGEICLPCHTPHSADPYGNAPVGSPIWNHDTTSATFTLYDSPTMQETTLQPRTMSKLCLSCHDGTIALDSFNGATGSTMISGVALIGTDLANDHPVSVIWTHQNNNSTGPCTNCHITHPWGFNDQVPFFEGYVECSSCHDVHNTLEYDNLLRLPMANSELCLHCHNK